jgi:hypothetical protein
MSKLDVLSDLAKLEILMTIEDSYCDYLYSYTDKRPLNEIMRKWNINKVVLKDKLPEGYEDFEGKTFKIKSIRHGVLTLVDIDGEFCITDVEKII